MPRPRILLCPQFTELEWAIAPRLEEWAEVATYDAPGVGDEPLPDALEPSQLDRELVVRRGLEEVERRGWDAYFVAGDAWGNAAAARIAVARPAPVLGLALGHASLDYETEGERAPVNGEMVSAMTQLMRTDSESFVRNALTQFTQGGYDEDLAGRMVARFPDMELAARIWEMNAVRHEPIGELLAELDKPLLLAKHQDCLVFTAEGFEDAVAAFPDAHQSSVERASSASDEFAAALREFCEAVLADR